MTNQQDKGASLSLLMRGLWFVAGTFSLCGSFALFGFFLELGMGLSRSHGLWLAFAATPFFVAGIMALVFGAFVGFAMAFDPTPTGGS